MRKVAVWTDEEREARSRRMRARNLNPEFQNRAHNEKQRLAAKRTITAYNQTAKARERSGLAMQQLHQNPEFQAKMREVGSQVLRRLHGDPDFERKAREGRERGIARRMDSRPPKAVYPPKPTNPKVSETPEERLARLELNRRRASERMRQLNSNPEFRHKVNQAASTSLKEQWKDPGFTHVVHSDKQRKAAGDTLRRINGDLESSTRRRDASRRRVIRRLEEGVGPFIDTKLELALKAKLDTADIRYEHPFNLHDHFLCDFYLPDKNLIIEADGCYWHGCTDCGFVDEKARKRAGRTRSRNGYIKAHGYGLLIVKEHEGPEFAAGFFG